MRILEQLIVPKKPGSSGEDRAVVTADFAAVIDGATDKSKLTWQLDGCDGTGGWFAAKTIAAAIAALPAGIDAVTAVEKLRTALDAAIAAQRPQLPVHQRPCASAVIYSAARRELWSVGDCQWRMRGRTTHPTKWIDTITSEFRSAFLTAQVAAGKPALGEDGTDPGREAILPLLQVQQQFANQPGRFGFGVLDGQPVPDEYVTVVPVPAGCEQLILASDGYPTLSDTCAETEQALAAALAADPLCIGELAGTKATEAGNVSYDDRTYLRLAV